MSKSVLPELSVPKLIEIDGKPLERTKYQRVARYRVRIDGRDIYLVRAAFVPFVLLCAGAIVKEPLSGEIFGKTEDARECVLSKIRNMVQDQTEYRYRWWNVVESLWRERRVKGKYQLAVDGSTKIRLVNTLATFDDERVRVAMERVRQCR